MCVCACVCVCVCVLTFFSFEELRNYIVIFINVLAFFRTEGRFNICRKIISFNSFNEGSVLLRSI